MGLMIVPEGSATSPAAQIATQSGQRTERSVTQD